MQEIIKENPIRKLARNNYYQILYNRAKELGNIQLFDNTKDFTKIQIIFLQYLELYANAYLDLALNEDLISDEVVDDWIRLDSYFLYKNKQRKDKKLDKKNNRSNRKITDRIIFRPNRGKKLHKGMNK